MTRRDVTFAAIMSAVALAVYIGVKVWGCRSQYFLFMGKESLSIYTV